MKTRETFFVSYFHTSVYNYVSMMLAVLLLSSCGLSLFKQRIYSDYAVKPLDYDRRYNILLKEVLKEPDGQGPVDKVCMDGSKIGEEEKKNCVYQRDLVIGDLIGISDGMCEMHMKTIFGNEAAFNIITGTFTNAFSGAATVFGGGGTKSILSALAFFSNSERSLVNETVYKSLLVPAVVKKINESRAKERKDIIDKYEKNRAQDYEKYPVSIALLDIIKYHQTCSFMFGLQKALEEGTQKTQEPDTASLEQKLKLLVLERDNRIRELKAQNVKDEDIKNDKYIKSLEDQIDAIAKKITESKAPKPEPPQK